MMAAVQQNTMSPQSEYEEIIKCALKKRDGYNELCNELRQALAAFHGGDCLYEYIYPFSRQENQEKLGWRRQQTVLHYRNFPEEITQTYIEGVFKGRQVVRSHQDDLLDFYLKTKYAKWFQQELAPRSLLLPELWVGIGSPEPEYEPRSMADVVEQRLFPYPVLVHPHVIVNYELDGEGELEWFAMNQGDGNDRIKVYTKREVFTINAQGAMVNGPEPHGFSRVPYVRIAYADSMHKCKVGRAYLKTVIDLSIANLQYTSMLVEMGYFHLSYKLVTGEETAKATAEKGVGNATAIVETEGEKGMTRYLALPAVEMDKLVDIVYERNPTAIYRAARLTDRTGTVQASGVAKALDMVPEIAALSNIAEFWYYVDTKITSLLVEAWPMHLKTNAEIQYPTSFEPRTPQQATSDFLALTNVMANGSLPVSHTFMREIVKQAQRAMLPNMSADVQKIIEAETDNLPFGPIAVTEPTLDNSNAAGTGSMPTGERGMGTNAMPAVLQKQPPRQRKSKAA